MRYNGCAVDDGYTRLSAVMENSISRAAHQIPVPQRVSKETLISKDSSLAVRIASAVKSVKV